MGDTWPLNRHIAREVSLAMGRCLLPALIIPPVMHQRLEIQAMHQAMSSQAACTACYPGHAGGCYAWQSHHFRLPDEASCAHPCDLQFVPEPPTFKHQVTFQESDCRSRCPGAAGSGSGRFLCC